jgi:RimJ/RimL family protein N-acetyltransferase
VSAARIETERLMLRGHTLGDFDAMAAMRADPAVTRHIGGRPSTREESWGRLMRYAGHWALHGFGFWAIEEKATGAFAGELGFADFRREIEPPLGPAPEMGWALAARFHGRGYASEALAAALIWGRARFGPVRTVCIIAPDNPASIRTAEATGFRAYADTLHHDAPTRLFERML